MSLRLLFQETKYDKLEIQFSWRLWSELILLDPYGEVLMDQYLRMGPFVELGSLK